MSCSVQPAWDLLTDTHKWRLWGPTVIAVHSKERYIRKGTTGYVQIPTKQWLPFFITEYVHERYWHWKVASINATGHRVIPTHGGKCRISFELPFLWAPYVTVCWWALKRIEYLL